jgi:hypothetical protein
MALKPLPQFMRERHGSLFDRGRADCYYSRDRAPHWWPHGTGNGRKIEKLTAKEVAEYNAGYDNQEANGDKKEW